MNPIDFKTVLVTGATGSFGRAFIKYALTTEVDKVIAFSRDELKQSEMQRDPAFNDPRMRYFIGDVRDRERLYRAFAGVDIVIHAAAMKQIDACSYNPAEAVKTNVVGAMNVIDAAIDCGVLKVLALSTDKACEPTTLYGKSKACLEELMLHAGAYSSGATRFACVRYGNVAASRGSVIPFFKQLAAEGKPLPITHPEMTRFWFTLDGAIELVMHTLRNMRGGELYVPRLPTFRVADLAEAIDPGGVRVDIGIRPNEKMHESMIGHEEARDFVRAGPYFARNGTVGQPCVESAYRSDNEDDRMSVEDIREHIGAL